MSKRKGKFLEFYNSVVGQRGYSAARVREEISRYCHIPEGTFNETVNIKKTNLNPLVVLAFCKTYGFDIDDIYQDEGFVKQKAPPLPTQADMGVVDPELPDEFQGRFYGYFFNSTPEYTRQGKLDQFILDIGSGKITMTMRHYALDSANRYKPTEIEMQGKIIHNRGGKFPSGILAIAFNSSDDINFCTLAYNKFDLHGPLYFRKGAMMVHSRGGGEHIPVMQSFIFTHKKIDLEIPSNRTILQGALALPNDTIWLEKNNLDAFMGSEAMREYFRRRTPESALHECYELNENEIRSLNVDDREELYRVFLQMKAYAAAPRLYRFPNSIEDRSWRCVTALCEEGSLRQEGETSQEQ